MTNKPANHGKSWTIPLDGEEQTHDDRLRELHAQGLTDSEIAAILKRTTGTVRVRRQELGITGQRRPMTDEDKWFVRYHAGLPGWTGKRIATAVGHPYGSIRTWASKEGISLAKRTDNETHSTTDA